ncbi:MAG: hypothetical protein LBP31_03085 [Holosporales bacterium]|nr:hypothetical protein [Holosporales bacterium]
MPKKLFLYIIACSLICSAAYCNDVASSEEKITDNSQKELKKNKNTKKNSSNKKLKKKKKTDAMAKNQQKQSESPKVTKTNKKNKQKIDEKKLDVVAKNVQADKITPVVQPTQNSATDGTSKKDEKETEQNENPKELKATDFGINENLQKKIDEAIDTHPENIIRLNGLGLTDENLKYVSFKIEKIFSEIKSQSKIGKPQRFILDISNNAFTDITLIYALIVKFSEMLVHLNISGTPIGDGAIVILSTANENGTLIVSKLRSLKLAKCGITNVDSFLKGLQKSPNSLGIIDFSNNRITDPHTIVMYLQSPNGEITKVNLSGNPLTTEGLQEIQECKDSIIFNKYAIPVPSLPQPIIQQQQTVPAQVGTSPENVPVQQQQTVPAQVGTAPENVPVQQQQTVPAQVGTLPENIPVQQQQAVPAQVGTLPENVPVQQQQAVPAQVGTSPENIPVQQQQAVSTQAVQPSKAG